MTSLYMYTTNSRLPSDALCPYPGCVGFGRDEGARLWPVLRGMPNAKHLHFLLDDFVHGDVGPWSKDQFACARYQADASTVGEISQTAAPVIDSSCDVPCGRGVVCAYVLDDVPAGRRLRRSSSERGSRLEKPVDASNHFVMFQQAAATGGSPAFLDSGGESRLVLEQEFDSFLNHPRRRSAGTGCVLQETGFLLRIEMEFHRLESKVCLA